MNDKIYLTRQDDTLRYRAIAQRTLAQDIVRVSIKSHSWSSAAQKDQAVLIVKYGTALDRFIPDIDWGFSTLQREATQPWAMNRSTSKPQHAFPVRRTSTSMSVPAWPVGKG
jgi:hypothetical protein